MNAFMSRVVVACTNLIPLHSACLERTGHPPHWHCFEHLDHSLHFTSGAPIATYNLATVVNNATHLLLVALEWRRAWRQKKLQANLIVSGILCSDYVGETYQISQPIYGNYSRLNCFVSIIPHRRGLVG
jgi:hypothetical protein